MAGKHVTRAKVAVIDLWLGQQDGQLAANGPKLLIIEKCARAQAGAIEDHALRQTQEFTTIAKLFHDHFAAGDVKVAQQRVQVSLRLDQHRAVLAHKGKAKVLVGIAVDLVVRIQIIATFEFFIQPRFTPVEPKGINPTHAVLRPNQKLESAIRDASSLSKLLGELGRDQ